MGVLAALKQVVYNLVVWTGVMNLVVTIVKPLEGGIMKLIKYFNGSLHNHEVVDASGQKIRLVKINGKLFPCIGEQRIRSICDIKIRQDDVMICGYPKTGCHWMFEILYMVRRNKAQLSKHGKAYGGMIDAFPDIILDSLWSPRVLNSHLLFHELPSGVRKMNTKIILTVRNPKDTVVSFYNHNRNLSEINGYEGNFNDYFDLFIKGTVEYGDYFDHLLHWEEIMKSQTSNPVLMVPYEELKSDTVHWIMKVANFLETPISQQFAQEVADTCEFNKMKKKCEADPLSVKLFRKGVSGDWKNWLSDAQSKAIDKRWREKMNGCVYQPKM